jgi:CRISPR-associated protein Csm2
MANYQGGGREERPKTELEKFAPEWITTGIKAGAIKYAEALGRRLVEDRFTTSQIRNFYGELIRIKMKGIGEEKASFHLLYPKLAYAAKRAEKTGGYGAKTFKDEIMKAHTAVDIDSDGAEKRFSHFCDLCEAILAFHKAHGGN